ncbi:hypothetical protein BCR44DRAFT_1513984 [Catenaria anguillulae PL171]|uniref:Uncharacterized protein n=1 Tax=Catenaria anguillulae PL171 TaxID=765915 RepID=A0A1Y2HMV1_9FUNG|nr:hypothetical protein BCR44DRAFT_1513984 [Catenaria anguillulae PL171]
MSSPSPPSKSRRLSTTSAKFPANLAPPCLHTLHNKVLPPTTILNTKWFGYLRFALLTYTVLAAIFFVAVMVNLFVRVLPRRLAADPTQPGTEVTFAEAIFTQFHFMIQQVAAWLYVAAVLSGVGIVMSGFGFLALYLKNTRMVFIYLLFSVGHVLMYAGVMGVTLLLIVKGGGEPEANRLLGGKPVPAAPGFKDSLDSWIILLTVLLPDFALWTLVRGSACFAVWIYYTELRMHKLEARQLGIACGEQSA